MPDWTIFRAVDWISVWKIYQPLFVTVYVVSGLPLRVWMTRKSGLASPNRAWPVSWILASLFIFTAPFASLPGVFLTFLFAGRRTVESFFLALPAAASVGLAGTVIDVLLFRFLYQKKVDQKLFKVLFAANAVNVGLAVGVVVEWLLVYPPSIIATLALD